MVRLNPKPQERHAPVGFFPTQNMGSAAILFTFIYLYLVFAGPGAWALDNRRD